MSESLDSANLPSTASARALDRAAMERVLARAAELQAASPGDAPETLTEEQVLAVAHEAGLSAEHVRQALAEERTRVIVPEEQGRLAAFAGAGAASASRTVRGRPAEVLAALDRWMQREECLQLKRRYTERFTWEGRRDLVGNLKRGFNIGGRGYDLTRADEVAATVVPVDEARVLVRLDADMSGARTARLRRGAATGMASVVGAAALVTVAVIANVALPLALGAGAAAAALGGARGVSVARRHRANVLRVQLALEQVLDRLEHGETKAAGLLETIAGAIPRR